VDYLGRYDLAQNKKKKKIGFVSASDTIAEDIQNHQNQDPDIVKGVQTVIRGKNLMIRGPNGVYSIKFSWRGTGTPSLTNSFGCTGAGRRHPACSKGS
jgi:hypothetical protein